MEELPPGVSGKSGRRTRPPGGLLRERGAAVENVQVTVGSETLGFIEPNMPSPLIFNAHF